MTQATKPTTRPRTKATRQRAATQAEAVSAGQATTAPLTWTTTAAGDTAANPRPGLGSEATPAPAPARLTKGARLLQMLAAPEGATQASLCQALGWQAHTVRAALTRLRQAGHTVERSKTSEGETGYRIVPGQPDGPAGTKQIEEPEAGPEADVEGSTSAPVAPKALVGGAA